MVCKWPTHLSGSCLFMSDSIQKLHKTLRLHSGFDNYWIHSHALPLMSEAYRVLPVQQFIFLRSEPRLKDPMAGAICEQSRGWCSGSLLVMPLSSGRFPKPDPPHPGTQGRGGVKT